MNGEERLVGALRSMADETLGREASPRVRAVLLREVRRRRLRRAAPWWGAVAAALVVGISIGFLVKSDRRAEPQVALNPPVVEPAPVVEVEPAVPESSPAISTRPATPARRGVRVQQGGTARLTATPWMVHQALPPVERGHVLRLPMSAELARQFGVPQQTGEWQAEIFVGDDGLARAFRLVRVPSYK